MERSSSSPDPRFMLWNSTAAGRPRGRRQGRPAVGQVSSRSGQGRGGGGEREGAVEVCVTRGELDRAQSSSDDAPIQPCCSRPPSQARKHACASRRAPGRSRPTVSLARLDRQRVLGALAEARVEAVGRGDLGEDGLAPLLDVRAGGRQAREGQEAEAHGASMSGKERAPHLFNDTTAAGCCRHGSEEAAPLQGMRVAARGKGDIR